METLIRKILKEETNNPLKRYWFNKWTKEEESGNIPKFDIKLIQKLGLSSKVETIEEYYVEYMGGQDRLRNIVTKYLQDNTFTTNEIENMGINVGGYDFEFKIEEFHINKNHKVFIDVVIIKGTVELIMVDGSIHDLKDLSALDDTSVWEITSEVRDIIEDFVNILLSSFSINFSEIDVIWN